MRAVAGTTYRIVFRVVSFEVDQETNDVWRGRLAASAAVAVGPRPSLRRWLALEQLGNSSKNAGHLELLWSNW